VSPLVIRDARPLDAGSVGAILTQAVREHRWMPLLHSAAEDIAHVGHLIDLGWVRVADNGAIRGFLAREEEFVHALYVARGARGSGVGRRLIEDAMAACARLELNTFVANVGARKFYDRLGFDEAWRTDGAENDERLPDIRLVWQAEAVR